MQQHAFPRLSVLHYFQCTQCFSGRTEVTVCSAMLQAGLGVAVQYANQLGTHWIWEQVQQLAAELRSKLSRVPGVAVQDRGRVLCGIVSFTKVKLPSCRCTVHFAWGTMQSTVQRWHSNL